MSDDNKTPDPVPYDRFKEVNDKANALESQVKKFTDELAAAQKAHQEEVARLSSVTEQTSKDLEASKSALAARELDLLRLRIAAQSNLPIEFADRLKGKDEAELKADAALIAQHLKPLTPGAPPPTTVQTPPAPLDPKRMTPAEIRANAPKILEQARAGRN